MMTLLRTWVAGLVLCAGLASAQPTRGFTVERLRITPDRSGLIDTEFGRVLDHLKWDLGLHLGYANDPLVVYGFNANGRRERLGSLVSDRVGASVYFGIGFFDWVQLSAELPFVFFQTGQRDIPRATESTLPVLGTTGVGDLRVVPKLRILRSDKQFVDLAVQLSIYFPLSGGQQYFGDQGVGLYPELVLSRQFGGLRLAGNLGFNLLRQSQTLLNLTTGNEFTWRLGAGFRFHEHDKSWVPLELDATVASATALAAPYSAFNQQALELKLQAAWHFAGGFLPFIGGGFGLQPGYGTPDFRLWAGLRFAPPAAAAAAGPADRDGDGVLDSNDACPDVPGFKNLAGCPDSDGDGIADAKDKCPKAKEDLDEFEDEDGCPDVDDDKDGILDLKDKCRLQPEDKDNFEDTDGCPDPDNDKDGVVDGSDACPLQPGVVEMKGCPDVDTDGDGLVDRLDNCPKEPGTKENNGCKAKQLVVITSDKLQILDSVYFKLNKAIIETRSYPLLDNVAKVLTDHPEVAKVRVEGHTDSQGDDASNLKLSQARAEAVRDYLVKKGVDSSRLTPVGFGESKPIADNGSKEGRAQNRRVEFNLVDGPSSIQKSNNGAGTDTLER
jgi:outer membrane protein OmpA-like peptidoglycan-associated protein